MAEKFWIANKYTNRISHRALSTFEQRNQSMFERSCSIHATKEEALAANIEYRRQTVAIAKRDLKAAERALAKALTMQKEASHG